MDSRRLIELRDELHTWTFENVSLIDEEYKKLFPKRTDRAEEISAPLRVMAALAGDSRLKSDLEIALTRQKNKAADPDNPVELLHEALRNLVAQGYNRVSTTHLMLEMRSIAHRDLGKSFADEPPEWSRPDWVGRMLRTHALIDQDPSRHGRKRLFGAHLRYYPISVMFIEEVKSGFASQGTIIQIGTRKPTDFCGGCSGCPYMSLGCEIMERRLQAEAENNR